MTKTMELQHNFSAFFTEMGRTNSTERTLKAFARLLEELEDRSRLSALACTAGSCEDMCFTNVANAINEIAQAFASVQSDIGSRLR